MKPLMVIVIVCVLSSVFLYHSLSEEKASGLSYKAKNEELRRQIEDLESELAKSKSEIERLNEANKKESLSKRDKGTSELAEKLASAESELQLMKEKVEDVKKKNQLIRSLEEKVSVLQQEVDYFEKDKKRNEEKLSDGDLPSADLQNDFDPAMEELENQENLPDVIQTRKVLCPDYSDEKPTLVFVVGAEGTGHHLVSEIVSRLPNSKALDRSIQKFFIDIWEPTIHEEDKMESKNNITQYFISQKDSLNPSTIYFFQTKDFDMYSFPFDDPRNTLRRPDLIDLIQLANPFFNVKLIVTMRDPQNSVVSLIRRKWWTLEKCTNGVPRPSREKVFSHWPLRPCGYVSLQARVVEDALTYISSHLQTLSSIFYRVVNYEELLENPLVFVEPLAQFINADSDDVETVLKTHIKKGKTYPNLITDGESESLKEIFSLLRSNQWAHLNRDDLNLINFAEIPSSNLEKEEFCLQ